MRKPIQKLNGLLLLIQINNDEKFKKISFSICLILISWSAYAQKNFTPAYVVSLKGDTINGYIDYKNWRKNPSEIKFKKSLDDSPTDYTPNTIHSFGIKLTNQIEKYISAKVTIDSSAIELNQLDTKNSFNDKEQNLFLLKLYSGYYTLYKYEDNRTHFFIGDRNTIQELKVKTYLLEETKTVTRNEQYKIQLSSLLAGCADISQKQIEKLEYNLNAFIKLFKQFDNCKSNTSIIEYIPEKIIVKPGIVLSASSTQLKINNPVILKEDISINSTNNFAAGISIDFILPKNNRSSSFVFELLYKKYDFETKKDNIISPDSYYKYNFKFSGNYIKINTMYRYQFMLTKLKPFLNIGMSNAFKLASIDKTTVEKKFYSTITNYNEPVIAEERGYEQGLNLGLGIAFNNLSIELRGEATNGFSTGKVITTALNSAILNLNYKF